MGGGGAKLVAMLASVRVAAAANHGSPTLAMGTPAAGH